MNHSLRAGLPVEFTEGIMRGLEDHATTDLAAGTLEITLAGYDFVDSSPKSFRRAADVLRAVLQRSPDMPITSAELEQLISTWGS